MVFVSVKYNAYLNMTQMELTDFLKTTQLM